MTHTTVDEVTTSSQEESKRERKKQARREAKLMLKVEQARQGVQKAEQKVAKAESKLEACNTYLHDLEAKLTQTRDSQEPHVNTALDQHETSSSEESTQEDSVQQTIDPVLSTASVEEPVYLTESSAQSETDIAAQESAASETSHEQESAISTNEEFADTSATESTGSAANGEKPARKRTRRTSHSQPSTEDVE